MLQDLNYITVRLLSVISTGSDVTEPIYLLLPWAGKSPFIG